MPTENSLEIIKNDVTFRIAKNMPNTGWYTDHYKIWEPETFPTIDRYLVADKYFLDVGTWVGPLTLYAGYKCRGCICVEADYKTVTELEAHIAANQDRYL